MAEYISKEFMLKILEADKMNNAEHCLPVTVQIMERFIRYVKEFPAADVQHVKRGKKRGKWCGYLCSECNENADYFISGGFYFDEKPNFCPNCGADMRGDTNG